MKKETHVRKGTPVYVQVSKDKLLKDGRVKGAQTIDGIDYLLIEWPPKEGSYGSYPSPVSLVEKANVIIKPPSLVIDWARKNSILHPESEGE